MLLSLKWLNTDDRRMEPWQLLLWSLWCPSCLWCSGSAPIMSLVFWCPSCLWCLCGAPMSLVSLVPQLSLVSLVPQLCSVSLGAPGVYRVPGAPGVYCVFGALVSLVYQCFGVQITNYMFGCYVQIYHKISTGCKFHKRAHFACNYRCPCTIDIEHKIITGCKVRQK